MSQKFNLFIAGYSVNAPSLYFSQQQLAGQYLNDPDQAIADQFRRFSEHVEMQKPEQEANLVSALSSARALEINVPPFPENSTEFFAWQSAYILEVETQFPMSRIEHYYFLYARKLAEISVNLGLTTSCLELAEVLGEKIDLSTRIDKCLKDTEYILFKLIAAAALLSSEPRQNYFNQQYRHINASFDVFRGLKVTEINNGDIRRMLPQLRSYDQEIQSGFKGCIGLLKDLSL